ncbi:MAG: glycosyltransferase family 2 protein [Chitinophagaceae bacterium]
MIQFSVIIPNYNHAPFLRERIESVLSQTYQDFELILLDDCSTDNSREIIESYRQHPKVSHIVYAEQNSGSPFRQWQKGIDLVKSDIKWIWIAESDDVAMPEFLEAAADKIDTNKDACLYFCNSLVEIPGQANTTTTALSNTFFRSSAWDNSYCVNGIDELNRVLKFGSPILNVSAVVFNKHVFKARKIDLSGFRYYGDWYAYIQMCPDISVIYNNNIYNRYRRTDQSHSKLMDVESKIQVKEECFRILLHLQKSSVVKDKKKLMTWFVRKYVGFGIMSDGLPVIWKLTIRYYSINFRLATRVLIKTLLLKLRPLSKK